MKLHSLLFLFTIVVTGRAYFLPARRRPEGFWLPARQGLRDRRTDSLDVEAQFSAEAEAGGADNYKDYSLQPSAAGFISGEGGGLVQAEAHASVGSQYGEIPQHNAGNSINEYGVDNPGEIIYDNNYGQVPQSTSSELMTDQTDQELDIGQADNTAQSTAEVQFGDTSQSSVEAHADAIIQSNIEFNEGAKFNSESQVDSFGQQNGGAQQGDGGQAMYVTSPPRPKTSSGANQYSGNTLINTPSALQTMTPWNNKPVGVNQYGGNPYSVPQYVAGKPYPSAQPNPYPGTYSGLSLNGASYPGGTYITGPGPYGGGAYGAGGYNAAYPGAYNGLIGTNKVSPNGLPPNGVPPNGVPPNGIPYNGGTGYNGLNQGNVANQYVGNIYSSGSQAAPGNQGNVYSQYGSLAGYNSSKLSNNQYSTANGGVNSKPGSNYGVPVSPPRAPQPYKGNQINNYQKLNQNTMSTQGRAPYSLINYKAGGEVGTENTSGKDAIVPGGATSTNVIANDSSKADAQLSEGSKYSGESNSNSVQVQEASKTASRALYNGEPQSSSEVKQGTGGKYPTQSRHGPSRVSKRHKSKKGRHSPETPYATNTLQNPITEAPPNEIPSVEGIEARFKHTYPHHDQHSPRWHHG